MIQEPGEKSRPQAGQGGTVRIRGHPVPARFRIDYRLVQMPAAGEMPGKAGAAHKSREIAVAAADLACRGPEQDVIVRRLHRIACIERALDLARPVFVFQRAQRQPDPGIGVRQLAEHRLRGRGLDGLPLP